MSVGLNAYQVYLFCGIVVLIVTALCIIFADTTPKK